MEQVLSEKKKISITYGEFVTVSVVILSSILMFWKTTDVRLTALELRMNSTDKFNESISDKLDKMQQSINEVNLTLKDKQDRKE